MDDSTSESQPRIVALTAHVLPEHLEQCEKAGMNDFLTKPIEVLDLTRVITESGRQAT